MLGNQARPPFGNKIFGRRTLLLWIIIGTLLFLSILSGAALFFSQSKSAQPPASPKDKGAKLPEGGTNADGTIPENITLTPAATISLSNKEIAEKVNSWLKSMKSAIDQQYYYALLCEKSNACQQTPTDKQVSITALWGQYQYYKNTGNLSELDQIKQNLVNYSKRSEIQDYWLKVYQPDFWHCKLLYEMSKDNVFNAEYKNYLKNICQNNAYFLSSSKLVTFVDNNQQGRLMPQDQRRFAIYNSMISDFASLYLWLGNEQYLKVAQMYFNNAKNYYTTKKIPPSDSAYLTLASLDLYLVSKDKTYLDFADSLYNQFNTADLNSLNLNQLTELCLTSRYYFDNISKNPKYQTIKNASLAILITKGFDNGKGAFHSFNLDSLSYETRTNALIIDCLIN